MSAIGLVLWTLVIVGSIAAGQCQAQQVRAEAGSVASGGNITGSQINIGIPADRLPSIIESATKDWRLLNEQQKRTIDDLKKNLGVNEEALKAFFITIGANQVPVEQLEQKLLEIAGIYKDLLAKVKPDPEDGQRTAEIKNSAREALKSGQLDHADELLDQLQKLQDAAVEKVQLERASTAGQRGQLAMAQLRYRDAARYFADAADHVPAERADIRLGYLDEEAFALYSQGDERGDNKALTAAVERYRVILAVRRRDSVPLEWAATETSLGAALERLGERESGTARLEEAVAAYRAALRAVGAFYAAIEEDVHARVSWMIWAMTQMNLGAALQTLGAREGGTARLEEAVAAYRAALAEYAPNRAPVQWSMTEMDLGNALEALWEREGGTTPLEQAVAAYRAALEGGIRTRMRLQWAAAQMNLGVALEKFGERESDTTRLKEAVTAYRAALEECTRDRAPLQWAMIQNDLGMALNALGKRGNATAQLEEAVAAYRAALEVYTPDRAPLQWAETLMNLANVLQALGQLEGGTTRLEEAVAAYRAALQLDPVPVDEASDEFNMGVALAALGRPKEALECFQQAGSTFKAVGMAQWAEASDRWIVHLRSEITPSSPQAGNSPEPGSR
jgi:tetratricopeptide (TPR) repeat protein